MSTLTNERVAWFNGEFMPEREVRIPFRDTSWVYGDGCFDMTRSFGHRLFKVKEHVDRLYRSLKYLRIDPGFGLGHHQGSPSLGAASATASFQPAAEA